MRRLRALLAVTAIGLFSASDLAAEPFTLEPGTAVVVRYESAILGSPVAEAILGLDLTGTLLRGEVRVIPPNTFLQTLGFVMDPALVPALIEFTGYRDVHVVRYPGFAFAVQFGGDPGLRGGGPVASFLTTLRTPQDQLILGPTSAFVYGFRGNQVLQDEAAGAVVPEPGTLSLLTVGLVLVARLARRRTS